MADSRRAGVLLHPTSLPSDSGNGKLGEAAYRFVDYLQSAGISIWQTLPLCPTHDDLSPYQSICANAGNPWLIDFQQVKVRGWLPDNFDLNTLDVIQGIGIALQHFQSHGGSEDDKDCFQQFCSQHCSWLDDYAVFSVLRHQYGHKSWVEWPDELREKDDKAIKQVWQQFPQELLEKQFEQFLFYSQWLAIKQYANQRGIQLFGDLPIFVSHDSVEVWASRELFLLEESGQPQCVAGVPPDYFSETGQRWGNPHYDWVQMQADGFNWWISRLNAQFVLFDMVRIDHFRGFEAYWSIPASSETAMEGEWIKAPGDQLFAAINDAIGDLPLVAEDLGIITEEVEQLRDKYSLPGMKILHFAFGGGCDNPYLPHNHTQHSVVYTGTHDNDTTMGWYAGLDEAGKKHVAEYLGFSSESMPWQLIRCAMASTAKYAIIPMQDILGLGTEARMNTPGTTNNNWQWQFEWSMLNSDSATKIHKMCDLYNRINA